jgi:V8-like Glu-specific endopeptidase
MKIEKPLHYKELRSMTPAEPEKATDTLESVTVSTFKVPGEYEPRIVRNFQEPNAYRLVVDLPQKQLEYSKGLLFKPTPTDRIPATPLGKENYEMFKKSESLIGMRSRYAPARYFPKLSQIDLELMEKFKKRSEGDDRPSNVFGTDERYIYNDSSFPWRTVGRVRTDSGACTGCTIGPRLVLTASHCINWLSGGGAGWVKFSPAYYNGNGPWGEFYATRVIYWNKAEGGLSDFETAFDYVVLVMNDFVGSRVGYPGYRSYSDAWNGDDVWQHMGYPGDLTSTQRPAFVGDCSISSTNSQSTSGQAGYVMGHFNDITGGHSGGPVWGWWAGEDWPRVVGVQSAEANTPAYNTSGDNEFGGGPALSALISYARSNYP